MATVVTHVEKGGRFVLLGASFSQWKTERSGILGIPVGNEGDSRVLALCGPDGIVRWSDAVNYRVVEIDGVAVADVLREHE